jgi:hypothetical protein
MFTRALLAALALLAMPAAAAADDTIVIVERTDVRPTLGIGVVAGSTTGLTSKLYLTDRNALAVTLGAYNFHPGVSVQGDWLYQAFELAHSPSLVIPVYVGGGTRISQWEHGDHMHTDVALRAPVGIEAQLLLAPIDFFLESAVDVNVLSSDVHRRVALTAALGMRYFF